MKKLWAAAIVAVLLFGGVACSQQDAKNKSATQGSDAQADVKDQAIGAPAQGGGRQSVAYDGGAGFEADGASQPIAKARSVGLADEVAPPAGGSGIPGVPQRVIKNANIEVRIAKGAFQTRFNKASAIAESLGGFVTNSSTEQTKGRLASGTLTIRVPSDKFQEALTRLRGLGKVTSESQNGQDVTREFVDLEARLRHAKAQEAFFLKLMDQSKTVSDLVQVQQQLANVQLEIEQLQGQINYLKDQTAFSSITTRIFEPIAAGSPEPKGLGKAMREAWTAFRTVIGGTIVFIGWISPLALLGLMGYGVWRLKRRPSSPAPTTT